MWIDFFAKHLHGEKKEIPLRPLRKRGTRGVAERQNTPEKKEKKKRKKVVGIKTSSYLCSPFQKKRGNKNSLFFAKKFGEKKKRITFAAASEEKQKSV